MRAQAGDSNAFETIYRRNVGRIYALCLRMLADPGCAESLTQDVFVRAWRKLSTFTARGPFGAWLRRLAVNVVIEDRRASRRQAQWLQSWGDPPEDGQESVRSHARTHSDLSTLEAPGSPDGVEIAIDLERAMAGLPPGARMAFVLHDVEGYRHDEIADMTGLATGTIKAQVHRARSLLRAALGDTP